MLVNVKLSIQFVLSQVWFKAHFYGPWYMSSTLSNAMGCTDEWVTVPTLKELATYHVQLTCLLHQMIKPYSLSCSKGVESAEYNEVKQKMPQHFSVSSFQKAPNGKCSFCKGRFKKPSTLPQWSEIDQEIGLEGLSVLFKMVEHSIGKIRHGKDPCWPLVQLSFHQTIVCLHFVSKSIFFH